MVKKWSPVWKNKNYKKAGGFKSWFEFLFTMGQDLEITKKRKK